MYLIYKKKLDITFIVKQLKKYNFNLKISYFRAIKKIMEYLKRIK